MTSRVIYPGTLTFDGLFLLTKEDLLDLDKELAAAKKDIDRHAKTKLNREVKETAERRNLDVTDSKKKLTAELSQRYPFNDRSQKVIVDCQSGMKIEAKTFADLLDNPQLANEHPDSVDVVYANARCSLELEIIKGYSKKVSVKTSNLGENLERKILRQFGEWVESKQRAEFWKKIQSVSSFLASTLVITLIFMSPVGLVRTVSERPAIIESAKDILKDGVETQEVPAALGVLLQLESGAYAARSEWHASSWYLTILAVWSASLITWLLCPRSTIGIGIGSRKVKFYQTMIRFLWLIVSVWLVGIAISVSGSAFYEIAISQ